jgi:hypothetical protein
MSPSTRRPLRLGRVCGRSWSRRTRQRKCTVVLLAFHLRSPKLTPGFHLIKCISGSPCPRLTRFRDPPRRFSACRAAGRSETDKENPTARPSRLLPLVFHLHEGVGNEETSNGGVAGLAAAGGGDVAGDIALPLPWLTCMLHAAHCTHVDTQISVRRVFNHLTLHLTAHRPDTAPSASKQFVSGCRCS